MVCEEGFRGPSARRAQALAVRWSEEPLVTSVRGPASQACLLAVCRLVAGVVRSAAGRHAPARRSRERLLEVVVRVREGLLRRGPLIGRARGRGHRSVVRVALVRPAPGVRVGARVG